MTICAVKLCHNRSEKEKKCNNITFHRIPIGDPIIADKWVKNIRLSRGEVYWKPTKNTRICSEHFNDEDKYITPGGLCKLHRNAVPVKNLHTSCTGTDDQFDDNKNVDEVSSSHGKVFVTVSVSSLNEVEDVKEELIIESPSQPSTSRGNIRRPSDEEFNYIFDTPREAHLRKKLNRISLLYNKQRKTIKNLKQKTRRLQKRNKSLKGILSELKKKKLISNDFISATTSERFDDDEDRSHQESESHASDVDIDSLIASTDD